MPMNPRILRPLARPLLLDAVPGAAAAYSLRQLSNAYTGPVVTVRRSSDNAEADFKAPEIDDGTLTAFCGAGDGLVKTWHDQSGNGRDASQGTAAAQPKILDSGSLVTEGGKAAVEFDGVDDWLRHSPSSEWSFFHKNDCAVFMACKAGSADSPNDVYALFGTGAISSVTVGANIFWDDRPENSFSNALRYINSTGSSSTAVIDFNSSLVANRLSLVSALMSPSNGTLLSRALFNVDGAVKTATSSSGTGGSPSASDPANMTIGAASNISTFLDGTISELIIYPSDQTANRERIEGDIAWYY